MKSFASWRTLFVLPVVAALWASPAKADNVIDLTTVGASGFDSAMAGRTERWMRGAACAWKASAHSTRQERPAATVVSCA